jgi:hypothetical protein
VSLYLRLLDNNVSVMLHFLCAGYIQSSLILPLFTRSFTGINTIAYRRFDHRLCLTRNYRTKTKQYGSTTTLLDACYRGNGDIIRRFAGIAEQTTVNDVDYYSRYWDRSIRTKRYLGTSRTEMPRPFFDACADGDAALVEHYLITGQACADDYHDCYKAGMPILVGNGNLDVIKVLLKHGADIE